jgi:hypothetical protein
MREKNGPGITDPIMETDPAFGGFRRKIWCYIANFHTFFLRCCTTEKSFSSSVAKVNTGVAMPTSLLRD